MELIAHAYGLLANIPDTIASFVVPIQGFIPNPDPVDPTNGSPAVSLLFSMLKGVIIIAAGIGALISILYLIFGQYASNPSSLSKGKIGIPVAVLCLVLAFITIPALNYVQSSL